MIQLAHPEAFLLLPLVLLLLRRGFWPRLEVGLLRTLLLLCALLLLARPFAAGDTQGRDVLLLVDRSRSMPVATAARVEELAGQLSERMQPGDRIGLIAFGRAPVLEAAQSEAFQFRPPQRPVDPDATDLGAALDRALSLLPPDRRGSLLLVSDGEHTGLDPLPAARAAARAGVRIDAMALRHAPGLDVAVAEVAVPGEVALGEPFQFSAWVRAESPRDAEYRLLRDGELIARGRRSFRSGLNRLLFRDIPTEPGVHSFMVEVVAEGDPVPENDRALGAFRVTGARRILCVTPDGRQDRLTRSLSAAGLQIVVTAPGSAPLRLDRLEGFRAVILENVPAGDLPAGSLQALEHFVRDLGGGFLMTGGRASFGVGGYHRSPVEDVLPVSLELRDEQRKFALAMAIALDRSGSMARPAGNTTKMDLANRGAVAAVELLTPMDAVAVIAVDSSPHVVVPMTRLDSKARIIDRIRAIESAGGGIYTFTALQAAAQQLAQAPQGTKHIVLFADAADAEEPGTYKTFVPDLVSAGVTVSVIGLGSPMDSDATFLEDVARLGNGRCTFVADPGDLPRVFAQETIQVSKSAVVEAPCAVQARASLATLGTLLGTQFPTVGGYSLGWRKDDAEVGLVTVDDQKAPLLSFWQCGLGRSAAYLGEVDGALAGGLAGWDGYAEFFATVARWLAGSEAGQVFADLQRQGHEALLSVEVEAGDEGLLSEVTAAVLGPDGQSSLVELQRVGERELRGRIELEMAGIYRAVLQVGEEIVRVPPAALPYSPEFAPRSDPRAGEKLLGRIAEVTGGMVDPTADQVMAGSRSAKGVVDLSRWFAWLAVVLLVMEIGVRRWDLRLPRARVRIRVPSLRRRRKTVREVAKPLSGARAQAPEAGGEVPPEVEPEEEERKTAAEPESTGVLSALERARRRGRR